MGYKPTKTASAGRFQNNGEDFIQFFDKLGKVIYWIDSDGQPWPPYYPYIGDPPNNPTITCGTNVCKNNTQVWN